MFYLVPVSLLSEQTGKWSRGKGEGGLSSGEMRVGDIGVTGTQVKTTVTADSRKTSLCFVCV